MVKQDSLGSDLDLVREFEELKLKQRLLVESLRKKSKSSQETYLKEFNSKLDFLVTIFTEANKAENKGEDKYSQILTEISSKIDSLSDRLDSLSEEVSKSKKEVPKTPKVEKKVEVPDEKKSSNMPPPPDFKVDEKKEEVKS